MKTPGGFAALLMLAVTAKAGDAQGELLFVRRIQPLFAEKCLACHGRDEAKRKGGLDVRSLAAALKGGESGRPALVPGKAELSPIYLAAARESEDWEPMPPKEADKLTAEQIGWIKDWIDAGVPWPDEARTRAIAGANQSRWSEEDGITVKTIGALSPGWADRKYKPEALWAYQPVKKPVVESAPSAHPVDALLAVEHPAPAADAHTFIRRATFDLTGLPPSPEEVDAFAIAFAANADAAVNALIDRLLASPHYGERMAQHWLDVTRYADSAGYANDYERGNAWRYRDYVVRSFNSDKPYDRFIREQIAGDELDPGNPELLVATGFLRMGPWELTGMEVAKVARQRFLDDVTNSVGETFLAHSLQCARCHDHKFDPVPTHDYYAVQACFATTQLSERPAPFLPSENTAGFEERKYLEDRRREYEATLRRLDEKLLRNAGTWFAEKMRDPSRWNAAVAQVQESSAATGGRQREAHDRFSAARSLLMKQGVSEDEYPPKLVGFTPEDFGNERVARKGLERLRWELDRYEPYALGVYNGVTPRITSVNAPMRVPGDRMKNGELEETAILTGGDPFAPASKVKPGALSAISEMEDQRSAFADGVDGRRTALANWIARPENPLTSRAIVNRVWMWHFDRPIAGNPNNFGSTGKRPTHPKLLDWLAAAFVEHGWSFKELHRVIMTSQAYRRGALRPGSDRARAGDPAGAGYSVFRPRRLTAEELRDAMLAATGELNLTLGGIPNRPEINLEAALQPRQVMGTFAAAWVPNPRPEQRHRRSLYALKLRGLADPQMELFNAPAPDFSCERREASTVTPQVFSLFNGRNVHSRALALASRVLREAKTDHAALVRCFQLCYGRRPSDEELAATLAHWRRIESSLPPASPPQRPPLEIRREAIEENTGERFTFSERLHAGADFIPDLQPVDCDTRTRALADICLVLLNSNEFAFVY